MNIISLIVVNLIISLQNNNKMEKLVTISELIIDNNNFVHDAEFRVKYEMVDNGIGPYECHGYKGRDINYQPEIISIDYLGIELKEIIERDMNQNPSKYDDLILDELETLDLYDTTI